MALQDSQIQLFSVLQLASLVVCDGLFESFISGQFGSLLRGNIKAYQLAILGF